MNRLQKKCMIGAAGFHLLLLLILFVSPAFLASRSRTDDMPVLDFIPANLINAKFSGGGTPNAKPPPPAPTPPTPPVTQPPPPTPQPPEPKTFLQKIFEPAPPKPEKVEVNDPDAPPLKKVVRKAPDDSAPKATPDISLKPVKIKANSQTTADSKTDAAAAKAQQLAAARARSAAVGRSLRNLQNNLSTGTVVAEPGPGGAAYANYAQVVKSVYTQAWIAPDDVADEEATTKVKVTIARDGTVVSARIVGASGSAEVDRSVQQTLNRVQFVAPFPEGATDAERTFTINFNLKAKRLLG